MKSGTFWIELSVMKLIRIALSVNQKWKILGRIKCDRINEDSIKCESKVEHSG